MERCEYVEISLEEIEEKDYIIRSLSSLFFSTYYMDLESDTFRVVKQLKKTGDVLGGTVECTAAMQVYAENFIHPDDRRAYLDVMNIENWRKTLRWWNPSVQVDYRRLKEDAETGEREYCRARAIAVLSRTDADDMPKTVVYVAQDIEDGRKGAPGHGQDTGDR